MAQKVEAMNSHQRRKAERAVARWLRNFRRKHPDVESNAPLGPKAERLAEILAAKTREIELAMKETGVRL